MTQSAQKKDGLSDVVQAHLRGYFDAHDSVDQVRDLYNLILTEIERPLIALTLEVTKGNQLKAAEMLGINRNTLRKKMQVLGLVKKTT